MIYSNLIAMFDCGVNDEDLDAGDFPLPPWLKHRTLRIQVGQDSAASSPTVTGTGQPDLVWKKWKAQPIKSYQIGQSSNVVNLG